MRAWPANIEAEIAKSSSDFNTASRHFSICLAEEGVQLQGPGWPLQCIALCSTLRNCRVILLHVKLLQAEDGLRIWDHVFADHGAKLLLFLCFVIGFRAYV